MFIWYYGNDTFKDGEIGYWHFYYLSQQIPALEANKVLINMEGGVLVQAGNTPQVKKRFNNLKQLITYGVKQS